MSAITTLHIAVLKVSLSGKPLGSFLALTSLFRKRISLESCCHSPSAFDAWCTVLGPHKGRFPGQYGLNTEPQQWKSLLKGKKVNQGERHLKGWRGSYEEGELDLSFAVCEGITRTKGRLREHQVPLKYRKISLI